jgi:hypothetical protein
MSDKKKDKMRDPQKVPSGGLMYLGDPDKAQKEAEERLKEAKSRSSSNQRRRSLFGGGEEKMGFANSGRTDAQMKEGSDAIGRANDDLSRIKEYRKATGYKKGGMVKCNPRKARRGMR